MLQTFFQRPDRLPEPLYVIIPVFNPIRWRSRWRHYEDFVKRVHEAGAIPLTVEVAFGAREFAVTKPNNPEHLQLRTRDPLWLKENAINLAVQRLPADWKYVAWVDADVSFARDDWADETKHQLQHWPVVQMWSEAHDLNEQHELAYLHRSLGWCWMQGPWPAGHPGAPTYHYYGPDAKRIVYRHPGYAWAARRDAFEGIGGLFDAAILGAGDYHMAFAFVGEVACTISPQYHPRYQKVLFDYGARAYSVIKGNVGYVEGSLLHYWHGSVAVRWYRSRWRILVDAQYDPDSHVFRDAQGLWQLAPHAQPLRRALHRYLSERNEDESGPRARSFRATMEADSDR